VAYLGFAVPYLAAGLAVLAGQTGAFVALTALIGLLTAGYSARLRRGARPSQGDAKVRWPDRGRNSVAR
jgi:hypothetical protein